MFALTVLDINNPLKETQLISLTLLDPNNPLKEIK